MAVRTVPVVTKSEWYGWIKHTIGDNVAGPALIEVLEFALGCPKQGFDHDKLRTSLIASVGDQTFSGMHYAVDSRGYQLVVGIITATSSMERMILVHRVGETDPDAQKAFKSELVSILLVGNRSVVCLTSSDDYVD